MEDFINTFHVDWKIMLAQILNFGLVFLALYALAAKPLRKVIKERGEEISRGLEDAKTNAETLKATKEEYEKALAKARMEANALFEAGKKEANEQREKLISGAHAEVAQMIENGKKTLEAEKIKMVNDAKNEVASLIISATEKILQEKNK